MGFGAALGSPFPPAVWQSPTVHNAASSEWLQWLAGGALLVRAAAGGEHAAALLFKNLQNTQIWAGLPCPVWLK